MNELVRAEAEVQLELQHQAARKTINRGIFMLAMVPVSVVFGVIVALGIGNTTVAIVALVSAFMYSLIGGIGGIGMILAGSFEHRRVGKELRELTDARLLPVARVVIR